MYALTHRRVVAVAQLESVRDAFAYACRRRKWLKQVYLLSLFAYKVPTEQRWGRKGAIVRHPAILKIFWPH